MNGTETVTPAMLEALRQTRPWARFLALVGFLSVGLMLVLAVVAGAAGMFANGGDGGALFFILPALYAILGVFYLFPSLYLFRYASAIGDALALPSKSAAIERALTMQKSFWKFVGIVALVMLLVYIPGILAAIAIPNLLTATQRAKQKRTMADVLTVAKAVESYAAEHNTYPRAATIDELARELQPKYVAALPRLDGWGTPLVYEAAGCLGDVCTGYFIASGGKDRKLARARPSDYAAEGRRETRGFDDDLVLANGSFLRAPEGFAGR